MIRRSLVGVLGVAAAGLTVAGALGILGGCKGGAGADVAAVATAKAEFAQKPTVARKGDGFVIAFAVQAPCDATVAVVSPDGPSTSPSATSSGPSGSGQAKVIRHLASGVLGANAPEPFAKGKLTQAIEWDGKDDAGQQAPPGCRARVSLGAVPVFDRIIDLESPGIYARGVASVTCAPDGTLVVLQGHAWERQLGAPDVSLFGRDGKYMKTIVPFRMDLPQKKMPFAKFVPGQAPESEYPNFLPGLQRIRRQTMLVADNRLIMVSGEKAPVEGARGGVGRRLLGIGLDGSADQDYYGPAFPTNTAWTPRAFLARASPRRRRPEGRH